MNLLGMLFIILNYYQVSDIKSQKDCECDYPIYYFDLSQTYEAPCELPKTITWEELGFRYELIITDCGGSGSYIATDIPKNKVVYSAKYLKPDTLSVDSVYTYDESTFQESLEIIKQYRPIRTEVTFQEN